ncbi:hypothetical protein BCR32DRAFT_297399 [Anaeromyces robustus]|uniref:Uncharacterized protein n=1 Tax=Anaeromyces robustus TaxID=1754192 RepID=A0A1Y1V5H4_9FUNG|nr:hypothetical protein BCR32DRAFT_298634 [Anaeromyces robustus]ORX69830.1 hypothetical protein BCR32DRAFT_297399 [Anaeromyces robustus]|eukprot:ORX47675.1 hypothetical protein BCR32DRAFT_298634 [Anaeromyces robustus]
MEFIINTDFNIKGELNNNDDFLINKQYSFQHLLNIPFNALLNINGEKDETLLLLEIGNIGFRIDKFKEYMINTFTKYNLINNKIYQLSIILSSTNIDLENPSNDIVHITGILPILNASLNKCKNQILYLKEQIEICLHELYNYTFKLKEYIKNHLDVLFKQKDNYEIQNKSFTLMELEKILLNRILYILTEKEVNKINEEWKNIYINIKNDITNQILSQEQQEVLSKRLTEGKQIYMDIVNKGKTVH